MNADKQSILRSLPAVHMLADDPDVRRFAENAGVPHDFVVHAVQDVLAEHRNQLLGGEEAPADREQLKERILQSMGDRLAPRLRRVINGTGVILHTNLGRALLGDGAVRQVTEAAAYYSNLEYDIETGNRGSRHSHVEDLICRLTGAEAAMVVNNNAAAVFLVLRAMAAGREVIISRGQLVEIGGSFRVSDIMEESGAKLVEVGTSNKTHLHDYERAVTEQTALLMKVHTSNFRVIGFTSAVSLAELVELGAKHRVPVYEDLGSGDLFGLKHYGIGDEPAVKEAIAAGADLVSFSGDKLLGGPQAGMIAGRKEWIDRLKKHPLARALRVDKMTLAALDSTLRLYMQPELAKKEIPAIRDILAPLAEIEQRAAGFIERLGRHPQLAATLVDDESEVGGGTLPGVTLPTKAAALQFRDQPAHVVEQKLRRAAPPVIVRIAKEQIRIDFRTIRPEEVELVAEAVLHCCRP